MLRLSKSGGRGIRTPGDREASTVFKTAAFNHSAIPPKFQNLKLRINYLRKQYLYNLI